MVIGKGCFGESFRSFQFVADLLRRFEACDEAETPG